MDGSKNKRLLNICLLNRRGEQRERERRLVFGKKHPARQHIYEHTGKEKYFHRAKNKKKGKLPSPLRPPKEKSHPFFFRNFELVFFLLSFSFFLFI